VLAASAGGGSFGQRWRPVPLSALAASVVFDVGRQCTLGACDGVKNHSWRRRP